MSIDITKKIKFLKLSQSSYDNLDIKDSYTFYKTENNMYYEDLLLSYYNKTYNYYIAFYSADDNSLNFCGVDEIPATGTQLLGKIVTTVYQGLDNTSTSTSTIPWYSNRTNFKSVIVDITFSKYQPSSIGLWFYGFTNLTTVDLSFLDTSQTTIMQSMFYNCSSLTSLDLSFLDTSKVTNISYMLYGCSKLTSLDLSNFDSSQVTTMSSMFYNCTSLVTIYSNDSNFVTTKVTSGTNMFYNCSKLVGGNGTTYSSSNVTYLMAHIDTASNPGYFTVKNSNSYSNIFSDNTPAQIQEVVNQGIAANLWDVGDSIPITLNGTFSNGVTFDNDVVYAFILGFDHNAELETNGKHNLALSFGKLEDGTDIYFPGFLMQDADYSYFKDPVGWNYCLMRNVYCPEFFDCLPDEWQKVVGTTKKYQFERRNGINEDGRVEYTDDQIFLMSTYEVGYPWRGYVNPEEFDYQQCYDYYAEGNEYRREEYLGATQWDTNCYTFRSFVDGQDRRFADSLFNEGTGDDMERGFAPCFTIVGDSDTKKHKIKFLELSQSSYDNLNTKDSYTFYKTENNMYYENLLLSYEEKKYKYYVAVMIALGDSTNKFDDSYPSEILYFYGTDNMPMITEWTTYGRIVDIYADIENTTSASTIPWYTARLEFSRVIFDRTFAGARPTSTRFWFWNFNNCKSIEGLEYLNTSKVINMSNMFTNCYLLSSINVSSFNTSNVTSMESMFYGCSNLISLDLSSFDTNNVTTMWGMFAECTNLSSLNILSFNTCNVTEMGYMFFDCFNLEILDLSSFDTSNVTGMAYIFNGDLNLITIYVNDPKFITEKSLEQAMFFGCTNLVGGNGTKYDNNKIDYTMAHVDTASNPGYFTQGSIINFPMKENNIINRKIKFLELPQSSYNNLITKNSYTFYKTEEKNIYFKDLLLNYHKYNYYIAFYSEDDESLNFCGVDKIPSENSQLLNKTITTIWDTDVENVGDTRPLWTQTTIKYKHIIFDPTFIKAKPTSTYEWFCSTGRYTSCSEVESIDGLKYLDTSNVTNMAEMFAGCSSLTSLDLSSFNTHNVTTMFAMFDMLYDDGGKLTSLDLSSFDTSNVTTMAYMFEMCNSLTSLNLSSFNTCNVTNMLGMFFGCSSLTSLDLSCFYTYNVRTMNGMFYNCSSLTSLDLTLLNDKSLYGNERINGTSSVTDMSTMFYNCTSLVTIYSIDMFFNIDNVTNSSSMFQNCTNLIGGNNTTYDSSKINKSMAHVDTADNPGYFTQGNLLSNNTPARIQNAVSRGIAADFWAVGDKVPITLNGTVDTLTFNNETYYAFILGFDHNADLETEGKHSLTLGFGKTEDNIDIAFYSFRMNTSSTNAGGWESSYMRNTICPAFYNVLPSEWQDVISTVTKYTDNVGDGSGAIEANITATKDQIFLLGSYEIRNSTTSPNSYEKNYQQQYDYYAAGNDIIKYYHSDTSKSISWWMRSPVYTNNTSFCLNITTGAAGSAGASGSNYGFAPAFCIIGN